MNICFANAKYMHNYPGGGYAHMRQFVKNATELGHRVWIWHGQQLPYSQPVSKHKISRYLTLRKMDVVYYRIEWKAPIAANWGLQPMRSVVGNPLVVWEFNSVPEYAAVLGQGQDEVDRCAAGLRHYGPGCDLAICVSNAISDYCRTKLGLKRVITVPNGSDPDLFRPDIPPVADIPRSPDRLNVVWIGSAWIKWHNFDLLKDTAAEIRRRGLQDRVVFHVIGNGFERAADTPPNLLYHPGKPYEELAAWLTPMDIGLCCYNPGAADYSSPLKVFDYMACGLTVVSTPQPQVQEIFTQLGQQDLMAQNNPQSLADMLVQLANDRARLQKQGAAGRRLAVEYYNWRRATRDALDATEKLLADRNAGAPATEQPPVIGAVESSNDSGAPNLGSRTATSSL
jgi:glycosyltransferase involved in cell wall biosynthesis